jgi:hypothetical protein
MHRQKLETDAIMSERFGIKTVDTALERGSDMGAIGKRLTVMAITDTGLADRVSLLLGTQDEGGTCL